MKTTFNFILFLLAANLLAQFPAFDNSKISKETQVILNKIEEINRVQGSAVGYAGSKPEQFENYEALVKIASVAELTELTRHPNGSVRSYAFNALNKYEDIDFYPIILEHINDYELIETHYGCLVENQTVGDHFLQNVIYYDYPDFDDEDFDWDHYVFEEKLVSKLKDDEWKELNRLILENKNSKLEYRNYLIENLEVTASNYELIRNIYIQENNQFALLKLAEYQNPQDIPLIMDNKDPDSKFGVKTHNFKAIMKFPDPKFLPYLENELNTYFRNLAFNRYESVFLYSAIAQYKNEHALHLLNALYEKVINASQTDNSYWSTAYLKDFISVITQYYSPIYNDLIFDTWGNHDVFNMTFFQTLVKLEPKKTYEYTVKQLSNAPTIQPIDFEPVYAELLNNDEEEAISPIPDLGTQDTKVLYHFVLLNDKNLGQKFIIDAVENGNFNIVSDLIRSSEDIIYIEPMFKLLEKESNAHIYLNIVSTLIQYKDKKNQPKNSQNTKNQSKSNPRLGK